MRTMHTKTLTAFAIVAASLLPSLSAAQTGVSDDRVSLPEGPGSLEGVGDNASINANMGQMGYSVPVQVPEGYSGMTPSVGLGYSSGGGNSSVGMGWSMVTPTIERMTNRGVPDYDEDDLFVVNGGEQLVRVSEGRDAVYRARYEGGFVRYTWREVGEGTAGYWTAEYPDGRIGYFGADAQGQIVATAREGGPLGTFRYHLVEVVDVFGHKIRTTHQRFGDVSLPVRLGYVFDQNQPRFEVAFAYEDRPDHLSDATGRYTAIIAHRLSEIRVISGGDTIQRHALTYEDVRDSGGLSRLQRIERFGTEGALFPQALSFTYSRSLGGVCEGEDCQRPYVVEMASNLGLNLQTGNATLIDINGDALPDLLETPPGGAHRFFLNTFRNPNDHTFTAPRGSELGQSSTHLLQAGNVQVLDVDGDGFADLLNTRTGNVLFNKGQGDWDRLDNLFEPGGDLPDLGLDFDPEDGELETIRFIDYDNDKRIDMLKSIGNDGANQTTLYRNLPGGGFDIDDTVESLEAGFDSDRLQLADINGDGLLDPVLLRGGALSYRLNLGRGRWSDWNDIDRLPFEQSELSFVELQDLNNDGLTDVVLVLASEIRYALGRNGESFDTPVTLDEADLGQPFPARDNTVTVLFADMNGSGSTDIVWVTAGGSLTYLELFPVQPGLLSRIENGLGMVTSIDYATSVQQAADAREAGEPWRHELPYPTVLVSRVDVYDTLSDIHDTTEYRYRDGYYDGAEKQFRGYGFVTATQAADGTTNARRTEQTFELGDEDPYLYGRQRLQRIFSDDTLIQTVTQSYEDCPLDGLPENDSLDTPIRFICNTLIETTAHEGAPEASWTLARSEMTYDGYGNITLDANLGIISIGDAPCAPCNGRDPDVFGEACGPQCLGDESYREVTYVQPDNTEGRWILRRPVRVRAYGRPDSDFAAEHVFHYDGEPFVGLPEGQLTLGVLSRMMGSHAVGEPLSPLERLRHDDHGNTVEAIKPRGDPGVADNYREVVTYDDIGLNATRLDVLVHSPEGEPYRLRKEMAHDPHWNRVAEKTQWMVVRDGRVTTPRNTERVVFDQFNRLSERYNAGDPEDKPSEIYLHEPGMPNSRIVVLHRTERGGAVDMTTVRCFNGLGRAYQDRVQADEDTWLVTGFKIFNRDGTPRRLYTRYESDSGECDLTEPEGVPYRRFYYDGLSRNVREEWITGAGETASSTRMEYGPTYTLAFDEEDTNPDSPHFDTPTRHEHNGQGLRIALTRTLSQNEALTHRFTYDGMGRLRGWIDPAGHEKIQTYDLSGRLIQIDDPDRGVLTYTHDVSGNITSTTDGAGKVTLAEYDSLNRPTVFFDASDPEGTLVEYTYDIPKNCPDEICTHPAFDLIETSYPLGEERGATWFGYDVAGNTINRVAHVRDRAFEFSWRYNNANVAVAQTFPDGQTLSVDYDKAMRIRSVGGIIEEVDYGSHSLVEHIRLSNGVDERYRFDARLRPSERRIASPSGTISSMGFEFDGRGNLLTATDDIITEGRRSSEATYTYDALYRMTTAHLDEGRGEHDELMVYRYDTIDNITAKISSLGENSPAHVGEYTYGARPHGLSEAGGVEMAYDRAGQMTRRGEMALDWDHLGRLKRVSKDGEVVSESFFDNTFTRMLQDTKEGTVWTVGPNFEIRHGVSTVLFSVAGTQIARTDSTALMADVLSDVAPLNEAGDAPAPDGRITMADALIAHQVSQGTRVLEDASPDDSEHLLEAAARRLLAESGQTTFTHSDHLGNAIATTDEAGAVLDRASYYPYGMQRGEEKVRPRGFNGKEHDNATGFVYFGARHLDPWLGRWISPDPLFIEHDNPVEILFPSEEMSPYAFGRNSPASARDVDGQFVFLAVGLGVVIAMAVGAVVGGAVSAAINYDRGKAGNNPLNPAGRKWSLSRVGGIILQGLLGAGKGALSLGRSAVNEALAYGIERYTQNRIAQGKPGLTNQQNVTASRAAATAGTTILSAVVAVGLVSLGITGIGLPVALGMVAAGAAIKAIHIKLKHHNVYRRIGIAITWGGWKKSLQRSLVKSLANGSLPAGQKATDTDIANLGEAMGYKNAVKKYRQRSVKASRLNAANSLATGPRAKPLKR